MSTAIATWGNSAAVRLPKEILQAAGLGSGDFVDMAVNAGGQIVIMPVKPPHRKVRITSRPTFDELFKDYSGGQTDNRLAWDTDDFVGAEKAAWLQ